MADTNPTGGTELPIEDLDNVSGGGASLTPDPPPDPETPPGLEPPPPPPDWDGSVDEGPGKDG